MISDDVSIPYSSEAEESVLGGLMLEPRWFDDVVDVVSPGDFFVTKHRLIFTAMADLSGDSLPLDVVTIADRLTVRGELEEVGGFPNLVEIAKNITSAANILVYAKVVKTRAMERELVKVSQEVFEIAVSDESLEDKLESAQAAVLSVGGDDTGEGEQINTSLRSVIDSIGERFNSGGELIGESTGLKELDELTQGLRGPDLIILAARPGMGKTALAMNIAEHIARQNKPVLTFSMEMSRDQLMERMVASAGQLELEKIRTGKLVDEDWSKLTAGVARLKDKPLIIDDRGALGISQIRRSARKWHRKNPLSLIVIDYLQLATAKAESRVHEVSAISAGLKSLAKELDVPVLCLSQLSRKCEERGDKHPINADLRDSGAIEQDADQIWFLYRDEYYNEQSPHLGIAELNITKNRHAAPGKAFLSCRLNVSRFENLLREVPEISNEQPRRRGFA